MLAAVAHCHSIVGYAAIRFHPSFPGQLNSPALLSVGLIALLKT